MNIFERNRARMRSEAAPLADRMRPRSLDEMVGQKHIIGEGKLLRRAVEADRVASLILYGPPGSGKTTLAYVVSEHTESHFERMNAVTSGVKDIRRLVEEAKERLGAYSVRTILFIDEVHRFNKAQQDALLPHVEDGTVIFIGATTENPYFEVIPPLVSRSQVFELYPLSADEVQEVAQLAIEDEERGLGRYRLCLESEALQHIVNSADGDARVALNALELAAMTTAPDSEGERRITLSIAEESVQKRVLRYDREGDAHYDTISAFIKSMRGSDPDATLYWLARMIYAGEDPRFIARRLIVHAAEDVGLADPNALNIAVSCAAGVERVGMPEGRLLLAQAALYIATAPKSNSVLAVDEALQDVEKGRGGEVPSHLRDASYASAEQLGRGEGYRYPHAHPGHWVRQQYLPEGLQDRRYYRPSDQGYERSVRRRSADREEENERDG